MEKSSKSHLPQTLIPMIILSKKSKTRYIFSMKILHLISQTPDFTGSGKYIQALLSRAGKKGHENYLVAGVQGDFSLSQDLIAGENILFVRFNSPRLPFPLPGMSDVMPYPSTVFSRMTPSQILSYETAFKQAIEKAVKQFQPDLIHSHHLWIVSATACGVAPDIPMVTTCHGTCLRQYANCKDLKGKIRERCKKINRIMALSHHQKKEITTILPIDPRDIDVVGIGFDDTLFHPGPKPPAQQVELLYAGKLCRAKGVHWLLTVLKKQLHLPWRLHLAGDGTGPEKERCLKLAQELGHRVVVHGPLPHHALAQLMRDTHVFVLPSFFEGVPLVVVEALACGCRIITTTLPGTREVLGNKETSMLSWVHLPPLETVDRPFDNDLETLDKRLEKALLYSIHDVIKNPRPDLETARALTEPCTWKRVFARVEKVYEKVLQRQRNEEG